MSPIIRRAKRSTARTRIALGGVFALALAVGLLVPLMASASHKIEDKDLPLTAPFVENISACKGAAGVSIPTGTVGNANVKPDRNNTSSSNEGVAGTFHDLVIHANAESDPKELTLDISGSHNVLDGLANSRSHLKIGGSWNQLRHGAKYGQRSEPGKVAFDLTGSNNCFSGPDPDGPGGDPAGTPTQEYQNAPPASPAGFPFFAKFDPDQDGNVLEHFAPGSPAANAAMSDATNAGTNYFVCGIPDPDGPANGAAIAPGCSGSGASAIMDRNVQGQVLATGLYFVTGRAKISASNVNATLTVVTGQQLNVNGSFQGQGQNVFNPYTEASGTRPGGLLFASQWDEAISLSGPSFDGDGNTSNDSPNTDKGEDALKIEGSLSRFEGIIVATNGRTELAGEQNDFRCPVMGDRVRLNGSKLYFNASGCVANPGLIISKTPDGGVTVNAGANATFTITVTNNGSGPANNVDIDDTFPGTGWTIVSSQKQGGALPAGDSCALNGSTLHCDIATLGPGENVVVVVQRATTTADCANDPGTGIRLDNGSLTADPSDDATADADNNPAVTDPGHLFVLCPDAGVSKLPDAGTVNVGGNVVFTITITANGPGPSPNVVLTDVLPTGFDWTLAGADATAAACNPDPSPPTIAGGTTLTCDFGTIAASGTRTITLSAATTSANCGQTVNNTATISGDGDRVASNNTDAGSVSVICGAIRIDKNSTKGGAVNNAGAEFSVDGPDAGTAADFSVTDDLTAAAPDEDAAVGRICVDGLTPGATYTVNETKAPLGYGASGQSNVTVVAVAGSCPTGAFNSAVFTNPPLAEFIIDYNDLGSGETSAKIDCNTPASTPITPDPADPTSGAHDDNIEKYTNLPAGNPPIVYTCTISLDP